MKIAVTGHRPDKLGGDYDGTGLLSALISKAIANEIEDFNGPELGELIMISGMALGVDTIYARLAMSWHAPLIAAVPFPEQDCKWPEPSRRRYHEMLQYAESTRDQGGGIHYVCAGPYSAAKMQIRNEWMVNNCDLLIAVYDGTPGGTRNCLDYARRGALKPNQIITINPKAIPV